MFGTFFQELKSAGAPVTRIPHLDEPAGPLVEAMSVRSNAAIARLCSGFFIVILLLFGASGCGEQTEPPARPKTTPETTLARTTFTLGGTSFAIFLPETAAVSNSASGHEVTIDLTKGKRLEQLLILATAPREPGASYDRKLVLANGGRLEYQVKDNTGGGSGGPVAELTGRMETGSLVLSVTCTDQGEWSREPDWCLPYLNRLEIVERGP